MSHVLFILVCTIWGTSFLLMKKALDSFGFIGVGAGRVALGAAALAVIWRWHKRGWPMQRGDGPALLLLAVVGYAIPFCVQPFVIDKVQSTAQHGSAFGGMMVSLVPILTIMASIPMLKIYPTTRQCIGVLGGLGFLGLLFAEELQHDVPIQWLLLGAVTPLCYGFANTFVKRRFEHVSPMGLTMMALTVTSVILVPMSMAMEPAPFNEHFAVSALALLALGVICTGIAGYFFYKLIRGHGPLYAGMVAYIIPCVSLLVGWLDNEQLTLRQLGALAGIFAMVAMVQYRAPLAVKPVQD